jgi:hypothetical protein
MYKIMYTSSYQSIFRVHSLHEAQTADLEKISEVDLFLFYNCYEFLGLF